MKQNFVIRSNGAYEMGKNFKNKEQNLKIWNKGNWKMETKSN